MPRKKPLWIKGGIIYDPNIPMDPFDSDYETALENRRIYRKAKGKRRRYRGF